MEHRGRIREGDIAAVRERTSLEDVVGEYVTLKRAGGGNLKGLCPFHDEKGASFNVSTTRNLWHCFGCQAGGDVIAFLQRIAHLDFIETIEQLADRIGYALTYDDGPGPDAAARAAARGQRARMVAAHKAAAAFYATALFTPEARHARQFLTSRGFDRDAATEFGVGYSPDTWDALVVHLRSAGFTDADLLTAGLASQGKRGLIDFFRGRLMWPIVDTSGDVVGFGARKLSEEDTGPKYLNTGETPIYKKTRVLYGLDKARKSIAATKRVVVVEGYTDVMACHLSGQTTAVATCGTAFGEEHIRVLRRLLDDRDVLSGEIIYTFDGDKAGQKAALRAFEMDDQFQTRTFVAVEPSGMDPNELRISGGDSAVHDLIESRIPLFEYAIRTILGQHDLSTSEGRVNALTRSAPLVARIRDRALVAEYTRRLSRWLSQPEEAVTSAVREALSNGANRPDAAAPREADPGPTEPEDPEAPAGPDDTQPTGPAAAPALPHPDPTQVLLASERETLRLLIQHPAAVAAHLPVVTAEDYRHPTYRALFAFASTELRNPQANGDWVAHLLRTAPNPVLTALVTELAVEADRETATSRFVATLKVDQADLIRRTFIEVAVAGVTRAVATVTAAMNAPGLSAEQMAARNAELFTLLTRKSALRSGGTPT